MIEYLITLRWQDVLDILLVAFIIYEIILFIRGTRAVQMVAGLAILVVFYFMAREVGLQTLHWLLGTFLSSFFLLVVIIFQDDIRRALMQVGRTPFLKADTATLQILEEVVRSAVSLSNKGIGGLIAIEREAGLKDYLESGVPIDARVSREILLSIFYPTSPIHDGAVIIRNGRISHAGCFLPLSTNPFLSKKLGTRHRAAVGLTEHTDAVVVVVSEETGTISAAIDGKITRDLDAATLRNMLQGIWREEKDGRQWWKKLMGTKIKK
ncbi:MAG: diadenylate cyclase CdaA [Thermodesulfobacteriota bacterium]